MSKNLKTIDIELAVSKYLDYRTNLIVPNISWGLGLHECDLLVITKAGYAWEIEIKITKQDLIKDKEKIHGHRSDKIKYLYFAIPDYMIDCISHIPERAGIIVVNSNCQCSIIRKPFKSCQYKFSVDEKFKVARLGSMRIWGLKEQNIILKRKGLSE